MSQIIEKRTVKIPPCRISRELVQDLGEILEHDEHILITFYSLDSKQRDIQSNEAENFIEADWGTQINRIVINTPFLDDPAVVVQNHVGVNIDFNYPQKSEFSVSGEDATWVNGITSRLDSIFQKYKTSHYYIRTNPFVTYPLCIATALVLTYPFFLASFSFLEGSDSLETILFLSIVLMTVFAFIVYGIVFWLFPYFEYGEMVQRRVRKWIWVVLWGSGIVPTIIMHYLGLP